MFDVIEVSVDSNLVTGFMTQNKTKENAEAVVMMAIIRRGVEGKCYVVVEAGSYKVGDTY